MYSPNVKRINFHHKVGMASRGSHMGTPSHSFGKGLGTNTRHSYGPGRGGGLRYIYKWSVCSIYCKAIEDVLVFKMIAPNSLKKIIKCVTYKELK